jgi:signal transduction histidine kinase
MSIKRRFLLLLGLLLGGFAVSVVAIRWLERGQLESIRAGSAVERGLVLDRWLAITARKWDTLVLEYAQGEELGRLLNGETDETRARLAASLNYFDAAAAWVLRPDGSVWLAATVGGEGAPALPVPAADFTRATAGAPTARFFANDESGLLEIGSGPVRRGDEPPRGWLLVARRWDETRLHTLGGLAEGTLTLQEAGTPVPVPPPGRVVLTRPLNDLAGRPLRLLRAEFAVPDLPALFASLDSGLWIFLAFGLLVVGALALGLLLWVLRPLELVSSSLGRNDPAALSPLRGDQGELGRVAQLVESSFEQRDSLRREIAERARVEQSLRQSEEALRGTLEERARLGRNLHDGVIQALYAAGMGLAGIRVLLRPEQEEAVARLEQTRAVLNESVTDLRNFIAGLEPEAAREQTFTHAVTALLDYMQSIRPVSAILTIDEGLAARLTLVQRAHALQFAREAVSNALRHGEATEVRVSLQARGDSAIFAIEDNGRGFDPVQRGPNSGRGLENLAGRARELGAQFQVRSEPGRGTHVTLILNPEKPSS